MRSIIKLIFLFSFSNSVQAQIIEASYTSDAFAGPFSGKVILYLSKECSVPKDMVDNIPPFCCFSIEVRGIKPGMRVTFNDNATSFPACLSDIERGEYYAQVVWDRNTGGRNIGSSPDNMFNESVKMNFTKKTNEVFRITCDTVIPHAVFEDLPFMKELKVHSDRLTAFYQRETTVDGAVNLPSIYYTQPLRKFPIEFVILGFGGDYTWNSGDTVKAWPIDTFPCIRVFLDGNCPWGHSTYANSMNTGPWGDALVEDFIPNLEQRFRCNGARFVSGHSSGGWSALWLQINYPEIFAGCWASSPDPVDFRNFQMVNLYTDKNLFYDSDSSLIPDGMVAGQSDMPWIFFKDAFRIENVLWRGEQYWSWNAVWSEKQKNGLPENICNPNTGEIDSITALHWRKYDISYILRTQWATLKPALDGKIRITAGTSDNFSLDKSVMLLEEEMQALDANMEFRYYPGDHFTVWTNPTYHSDGCKFLAAKYIDWLRK